MRVDVLLVEDDIDVLDALRARFQQANLSVQCCKRYIEAIDHISVDFAGCIVTDIRMPGKSGHDLIAKVNAVDPTLPVLVLTGFAETETVVKAMQAGAITVLEKPCPMEVLLGEVSKSIAARRDVLETRKTRAQNAARGRPPIDKALSPQVAAYETELIVRAIKRNNGDKVKAAKELGISRSQLYAKLSSKKG
jgi:two-component system C4-dicarboxylate transport response regulator DctD